MAGRVLDAGLHLLDRQLVDKDGRLAGKVDDLELTFPEGGGPPQVTAILAGPGALSRRIGGRFGSWLEAVANRLRDGDDDHPVDDPDQGGELTPWPAAPLKPPCSCWTAS